MFQVYYLRKHIQAGYILPLYKLRANNIVSQVKPAPFSNERELQRLFEANLLQLLGVQFITSDFTTSDLQWGTIDTLDLDQDRNYVKNN